MLAVAADVTLFCTHKRLLHSCHGMATVRAFADIIVFVLGGSL